MTHAPTSVLAAHPRFSAALAMVCVAFTVPLFIPGFLPFADFGAHVAELFVLANPHHPGFRFEEYYRFDGWLHPYTVHRLALVPLAWLVGADGAYRAYQALYIWGVPWGTAALLGRTGKSPWLAMFSFPLLYSYPVLFGFTTYTVSVAALMFAMAALERHLAAPSRRTAVLVVLWASLTFFAHPQSFLYWCVLGPALTLLNRLQSPAGPAPWRALTLSVAPWAILVLAWSAVTLAPEGQMELTDPNVRFRILAFPAHAGLVWNDNAVFVLWLAYLAVLGWILVGVREGAPASSAVSSLWQHRYVVVVGLLLAGAFVLPEVYKFQHYIASRMVPAALAFVPLCFPSTASLRRGVIPLALTGMGLTQGLLLSQHMREFDQESRPFSEIIEAVPQGAKTRCEFVDNTNSVHMMRAYSSFCGYVIPRRGGLVGNWFGHIGVAHAPGMDPPAEATEFPSYADHYEYVVTRVLGSETPLDAGGPFGSAFTLVKQAGPWRLYQRTRLLNPATR